MTKLITTNSKKMMKFTKRLKNRIVGTFTRMLPEDTAYYFVNVAGDYEKELINKSLKKSPKNYKEWVWYYINHPIELMEKISESELEKKIK